MEVYTVEVEEDAVGEEHHVHVDGDNRREDEEGEGTEELVDVLVGDYSEGRGVEEHMVVLR